MCGRYITAQAEKCERAVRPGKISWHFHVSHNVAPTQPAPVIASRKQPNFIHLSNDDVCGFASIWDRSFVEEGTGIESCALVTFREIASVGHAERPTMGGGRVLLVSELLAQILRRLAELDPSSAPVPEQWPLIRSLQWAVACGEGLLPTVPRGGLCIATVGSNPACAPPDQAAIL